jgi:hypothetical protein
MIQHSATAARIQSGIAEVSCFGMPLRFGQSDESEKLISPEE